MLPEGRPFPRDTRRAYGDDKDVGPHPNGLARGPGGRPAERHNGLDKGYLRDDIRRSELDARPAAGPRLECSTSPPVITDMTGMTELTLPVTSPPHATTPDLQRTAADMPGPILMTAMTFVTRSDPHRPPVPGLQTVTQAIVTML